jgi:hypothetical protein
MKPLAAARTDPTPAPQRLFGKQGGLERQDVVAREVRRGINSLENNLQRRSDRPEVVCGEAHDELEDVVRIFDPKLKG